MEQENESATLARLQSLAASSTGCEKALRMLGKMGFKGRVGSTFANDFVPLQPTARVGRAGIGETVQPSRIPSNTRRRPKSVVRGTRVAEAVPDLSRFDHSAKRPIDDPRDKPVQVTLHEGSWVWQAPAKRRRGDPRDRVYLTGTASRAQVTKPEELTINRDDILADKSRADEEKARQEACTQACAQIVTDLAVSVASLGARTAATAAPFLQKQLTNLKRFEHEQPEAPLEELMSNIAALLEPVAKEILSDWDPAHQAAEHVPWLSSLRRLLSVDPRRASITSATKTTTAHPAPPECLLDHFSSSDEAGDRDSSPPHCDPAHDSPAFIHLAATLIEPSIVTAIDAWRPTTQPHLIPRALRLLGPCLPAASAHRLATRLVAALASALAGWTVDPAHPDSLGGAAFLVPTAGVARAMLALGDPSAKRVAAAVERSVTDWLLTAWDARDSSAPALLVELVHRGVPGVAGVAHLIPTVIVPKLTTALAEVVVDDAAVPTTDRCPLAPSNAGLCPAGGHEEEVVDEAAVEGGEERVLSREELRAVEVALCEHEDRLEAEGLTGDDLQERLDELRAELMRRAMAGQPLGPSPTTCHEDAAHSTTPAATHTRACCRCVLHALAHWLPLLPPAVLSGALSESRLLRKWLRNAQRALAGPPSPQLITSVGGWFGAWGELLRPLERDVDTVATVRLQCLRMINICLDDARLAVPSAPEPQPPHPKQPPPQQPPPSTVLSHGGKLSLHEALETASASMGLVWVPWTKSPPGPGAAGRRLWSLSGVCLYLDKDVAFVWAKKRADWRPCSLPRLLKLAAKLK